MQRLDCKSNGLGDAKSQTPSHDDLPPHLDYDFQRFPEQDPERVAELDACAERVIEAAEDINAKVVVISSMD